MANAIDTVLQIACNEVGYLEKETNANLYDKQANAGNKNYTKYANDLDKIGNIYNSKKNGYAWCDMFVDWCFITAFGVEKGLSMIYQPYNSAGAGCYYSSQYYKNAGRLFSTPKRGDQIFFIVNNIVGHTGLVYDIDETYVYIVEGNTTTDVPLNHNGTTVAKKKYRLNNSRIYGYGRPNYELIDNVEEEENMTQEQFNTMMDNWVVAQTQKDPASWSSDAREWAERNGLISGDTNGNKMYKKLLTREELITVLYRALHRNIID